jgi:hypothetical protein
MGVKLCQPREEHNLTVFDSSVLGIISGSKGEEITGWRILSFDEHHDLHSSQNSIRIINPLMLKVVSIIF